MSLPAYGLAVVVDVLNPILLEHWAAIDVVTGLSGRQFLCLGAEFLERDTRVLQGTTFGQLSAFGAEIGWLLV